jgi:hypothetical protein
VSTSSIPARSVGGASRFALAAAAASFVLAAGCAERSRDPDQWITGHRLLEEGAEALETIGRESRRVVHSYPLYELEPAAGPAQSSLYFHALLPAELAEAEFVVVEGLVEARGGVKGLSRLDRQRLRVERSGGHLARPFVRIDAGARRHGRVSARARLAEGGAQRLESRTVDVGSGDQLRVGFGVLEAAWDQGDVAFAIDACEDGRCTRVLEEVLDPSLEAGRSWQDRRIPLRDLGGRSVSFTLSAEPSPDVAFSLPVWSNPLVLSPAAEDDPKAPNLILISLDTLRADHMGAYGYARRTSPFLDALFQARGTIVENAVASATMTQPSHFTMLTGLPPSVHRLVEASGTKILPPAARTLAQELRDAGVATAAATENAAIVLGSGIERGFESYSELRGRAANHKTGDIELTLASARSWLERNGDEDSGREVPHNIPEDLHPDRYDREIRYTDDTLRSFFAALEEAGWLEDTIVVVTSDHGEAFLEHGYLAHGAELHQELVHIPLMLLGPGITAGQRLQVPLGHADLMPTLLELMNAAAPPVANRTYGRSFAPLLRGETTAAELAVWRRRPVTSTNRTRARQAICGD